MGLVTVVLLMGMLIGTRWHNKGEQVEMEEANAKELASMRPPRVQILGPGSAPAPLALSDDAGSTAIEQSRPGSVTTDVGTPTDDQSGQPDDSLESAGFAGKTLQLLIDAEIKTVSELKAKIEAGEKIVGVGEKTLASIQAQLEASQE